MTAAADTARFSGLVVKGLSRSFGGVRAVSDVDFTAAPGQLLALIGPNGAGKTTCFNMLNGQLKPDAGSAMLDGRELIGLTPQRIWRLGVGRTFQITATFPSMTVCENVAVVLMSHHRHLLDLVRPGIERYRDRSMELLDLVGMADQANRACGVLSYGDLKRVELAVALGNDPRLLLMDEPTAGMAPSERIALMELAAGIVRERGISILFTEHDMDVVFSQADRIIVLSRGVVIAAGNADEIRNDSEVRRVYLGEGHVFSAQYSQAG